MRLLLLGCTGLVGRELVPLLVAAGHTLTVVSRQQRQIAGVTCVQADPARQESWAAGSALQQALEQAEGVVNLAGEPIAEKRWTPAHLKVLHSSRIDTTRHLVAAINASATPPKVLVSASAVGFYGTNETGSFNEDSPAGTDVLGKLCAQWEAAAEQVNASTRLVITRIGIVLAADGGALGKMLPIFRAGFGGPIGSGQQWMSWIARADLCGLIATALTDSSLQGTYNATAPAPVTMRDFCSELGRALRRPSLLPVPGAVLKLLLGDGAEVVLQGQQVLPQRLEAQQFAFQAPQLDQALELSLKS
tara:strand:- start:70 stop:984 length:915 start_codon:yes stop_codon:yes gene_type:complete